MESPAQAGLFFYVAGGDMGEPGKAKHYLAVGERPDRMSGLEGAPGTG